MVQRSKKAALPRTTAGQRSPPWRRLVLLACALVLTLIAGGQLWAVAYDLPQVKLRRMDWKGVQAARGTATGRARDGWALLFNSEAFVDALHDPKRVAECQKRVRLGAEMARHSSLSRVQLATLQMLVLERDGVPGAQWWPRLEPYLSGLESADLSHGLPEYIANESAIYVRYGLDAVNADRFAQHRTVGVHGPFLQYFVRGTRHMANAEGTRVCRSVLRQFVLDPAPSGLRLLAAELLAEELEAAGQQPELAQKLREWRETYRRRATAMAPIPPLLDLGDPPPPDDAGSRLAHRLATSVWVVTGLIAMGVAALLLAVPWLRAYSAFQSRKKAWIGGGIATLLIVVFGWSTVSWLPSAVWADFRRFNIGETNDTGPPLLPFVAATTALLLTGFAASIDRRRASDGTWLPRTGDMAVRVWLLLGIAALPHISILKWEHVAYKSRPVLPLAEQVRTIADPNADGLLDDLQVWEP